MKLIDLKQAITSDSLSDDLIIFVCEDTSFIADQYIDEICSRLGYARNKINSIYDTQSNLSAVVDFSEDLNILRVDTFEEIAEDYSDFKNTVVVCKKVDKKILSAVEPYIVNVPKFIKWQVEDYMKVVCPGLSDRDYSWLYDVTGGNIYRINNELDKLSNFNEKDRREVLYAEAADDGSDLYMIGIFDVVDAIFAGDSLSIREYLRHKMLFDYDPIAIVNMLLKKAKLALLVNHKSGVKLSDLGEKEGLIKIIQRNYSHVSEATLIKYIDFLSSVDLKLKSGKLDMPKDKLIDYVVCKMLA